MNLLLSLNRKYILYSSIVIFILIFLFLFSKFFFTIGSQDLVVKKIISNVDITEPKFAINSDKQKIFVTAKEGNFINETEILLKNNVLFKSNNFTIETDNVIFDRKKQTAKSNTNSLFKSEKTKISSEGFNIYDNGKKIKFFGNAVVTLK